MSNDWAIEAHNTAGARFLFRRVATDKEIGVLVAGIMKSESTGGIVIYRSTVATDNDFVKPVVLDCETDEDENPENFKKVASGNLVKDVAFSNGVTMKAGPLSIYTPSPWCSTCASSHRSNEPHADEMETPGLDGIDLPSEIVLHNDNPNDYEGDEDYETVASTPCVESEDDIITYVPLGGCEICGCPPDNMPMVNRGTGWCSELHRKEQLARSNK